MNISLYLNVILLLVVVQTKVVDVMRLLQERQLFKRELKCDLWVGSLINIWLLDFSGNVRVKAILRLKDFKQYIYEMFVLV